MNKLRKGRRTNFGQTSSKYNFFTYRKTCFDFAYRNETRVQLKGVLATRGREDTMKLQKIILSLVQVRLIIGTDC